MAKQTANAIPLATRIADERRLLMQAAEESLMSIVDGNLPTNDDHLLFASLGWDADRVEREAGRIQAVQAHKSEAGTAADREAAKQSAAAAAQAVKAEVPRLKDEIAALQGTINSLESQAAVTARTVSRMEAATKALRALAPQHVLEAYSHRNREVAEKFREANELEVRLRTIAGVIALDVSTIEGRASALLHLRSADRELAAKVFTRSGKFTEFARGGEVLWQQYCDGLRSQRAEITEALTTLQAERSAAQADLDTMLDCYLD